MNLPGCGITQKSDVQVPDTNGHDIPTNCCSDSQPESTSGHEPDEIQPDVSSTPATKRALPSVDLGAFLPIPRSQQSLLGLEPIAIDIVPQRLWPSFASTKAYLPNPDLLATSYRPRLHDPVALPYWTLPQIRRLLATALGIGRISEEQTVAAVGWVHFRNAQAIYYHGRRKAEALRLRLAA